MPEQVEATGRVRVVKTPQGEAPEEIRKAWVGLELPCYPIAGYLTAKSETGVLSGEITKRGRETVSVPQNEALEILGREHPFAAEWWLEQGFPREHEANFAFGLDEVEIISGVEMQRLIQVTEEMQGNPYR